MLEPPILRDQESNPDIPLQPSTFLSRSVTISLPSNTASLPSKTARRWSKRLLLLAVMACVGLAMAASLKPEPQLKKTSDFHASFGEKGLEQAVASLNREFQRSLAETGLETAEPADWRTVCRRLSLALVGNGLSLEELRAIEQIPDEDRIRWWTNYLLEDRRSSDYLAERFTRAYVGTNNGPFLLFRRRKFSLWLADEIHRGTPYDQIVQTMIAAEGLWTDQPSVNFLTATMDESDNRRADPIRLAGRTTRAFLGMRMDCLQCHNDFLDKINLGTQDHPIQGIQQQFHELAAFYSGARLPENVFTGIRDDDKPYRYKFLGQEESVTVAAEVPYLPELLPNDGKLRQRLATWVTHPKNLAFSRATVNRVWALMFGKPLVVPVDDIPLTGPFPDGLELLARDFREYDHDLKRLIRIIAELDVFRRDSRSDQFEITDAHEDGWAVFPMTQLRPEQVAASIHQACRLKAIDNDSAVVSQIEKFGYVNDFTKAYGDRGEDEFTPQSVTIPQRLLVMNGKLVSERTENNPILNASTRIGSLAASDEQAIEVAYLSTLNRLPTGDERKALSVHIQGTRGDPRGRAMSDVFWILLNSTEFLWNH